MTPQLELMLGQAIQAFQAESLERAEGILRKVLLVSGNNMPALHILGLIKATQEKHAEAAQFFQKAVKIEPNDPSLQYNLAKALSACGRQAEALQHHQRATTLSPDYPEAWLNYGGCFIHLGRYDEAILCIQRAQSLNLNYLDAWFDHGKLLVKLGRFAGAVISLDRVLSMNPRHSEALFLMGVAQSNLGRNDLAVSAFETLFTINPAYDYLAGALSHARQCICDWNNFDAIKFSIAEGVRLGQKVAIPFSLMATNENAVIQLQAAKIWVEDHYSLGSKRKQLEPANILGRRLRIGYYSADFYSHAVSILTVKLFELHNRERFEIYAFSYGPTKIDEMHERVVNSVDHFVSVDAKTDQEVAELSYQMKIDIAVDLTGLTQGGRPGIFAAGAAPVQVNYLGYPGSIGASFYDYILGDSNLVPEGSEKFYAEKVYHLKPCYQSNDSFRKISDKPILRNEVGLPEDAFVFCCFNASYKITPVVFDSWMRILNAVNGSVLWLIGGEEIQRANLRLEAKNRGIDEGRLIFASKKSTPEYLASYRLADLFLDTAPFNAGTTASDALWVGLPVLTMVGESFSGRMAMSLLMTLGMPELIANSAEEYEDIAINCANDQDQMKILKNKLRECLGKTPLFDSYAFTRNIEAAYINMLEATATQTQK